MTLISSRVPLEAQAPEGWRKLWQQAQREKDPEKLDAIIKRVNRLLAEHEKRSLGKRHGGPPG
jgi:hypothetical protein